MSNVWERFRGADQIGLAELRSLPLIDLPEDAHVWVADEDFPDTTIKRYGNTFNCHIEDHIYTKFWWHKFSAQAFSSAMGRAVRRLAYEGHPFANPKVENDDVHIFVQWDLKLAAQTPVPELIESVRDAHDLVYARADSILENSDSVLVLGKDTGVSFDVLKRIAARLEDLGYYAYIIKEQPDKVGESIIQKVMRYALSCKFIVIENTESSGHLYEIPHVKMTECVTALLQERERGATWMFEDAYAKHPYWRKFEYDSAGLVDSVDAAARWAEEYIKQFGVYQKKVLPWMKGKP